MYWIHICIHRHAYTHKSYTHIYVCMHLYTLNIHTSHTDPTTHRERHYTHTHTHTRFTCTPTPQAKIPKPNTHTHTHQTSTCILTCTYIHQKCTSCTQTPNSHTYAPDTCMHAGTRHTHMCIHTSHTETPHTHICARHTHTHTYWPHRAGFKASCCSHLAGPGSCTGTLASSFPLRLGWTLLRASC